MQEKLQRRFEDITGLNDFRLTLEKRYDPDNFGEYFLEDSDLKLYVLKEDGKLYSRLEIEREALHELAHHMQIKHTKGYHIRADEVHDQVFCDRFAELLKKYYNGKVPQRTLNHLRRGGYIQ